MAEVNKISSFKSFSEIKAQDAAVRLKEENENKKKQTLSKIEEILDEMGLSDLSELDEDSQNNLITRILGKDANEGNSFIYAAAKAKQDGNNEFEFQGKTYKVTLKKDTGLKESAELIAEATRSHFGKIDKKGNITSTYVHNDGYPSHMVPVIKGYKAKDVDTILNLGKAGISFLDKEIGDKHDFNKPKKGWTLFYGRDRNETGDATAKDRVRNIEEYLKDVANDAGAEYVYLYDERDGKWYGADTYNDRDLKPVEELSESVVTEGAVKRFEMDLEDMIKNIKRGYGWIDPAFVADTWENTSDSIDFEIVKGEIYKRLIAAGLLAYADGENEEEAGKYVKNLKELGIKESLVTEAVSRATQIYQIATPAPKAMLKDDLEELFGDDYRNIVTEFDDDEGYESVLVFNLTKKDVQRIQNEIGDVLIWEYSIKKGKEITESVVTEAFSRMAGDTIENELYTATQKLSDYYDWLKAGNDSGKGETLDNVISLLKKCKRMIKRFDSKEEVEGTAYESVVTEGKNDYVARYKDTNINLKKAYNHLNDEELNQLYLEIGELIADNKLKVKDATFTFESAVTESHFKIGDKVEMSHGGTGVIVSLDKEDGTEEEKYYGVETEDGEVMKHAPNELTKVEEELTVTEGVQGIMKKMKEIADTRSKIISDYMKKFPTVWDIETKFSSSIAKKIEDLQSKYSKLKADLNIQESVINEDEINTDEEFKEYAFTVLKKAFQKDFNQDKANDVVDGILASAKDDYGVAIGMLVKSLG